MDKESKITKDIFNWAVKTGTKKSRLQQRGKSNPFINAQYMIADKLVLSKIRAKLGGRMRLLVSGGAPLPVEAAEFFQAIGITVLQGYGLTEASPVVSATRYDNNELGTIGQPLYNVEIKIAGDGEILVKGPNVMKGYWEDEEATDKAIDPTAGYIQAISANIRQKVI